MPTDEAEATTTETTTETRTETTTEAITETMAEGGVGGLKCAGFFSEAIAEMETPANFHTVTDRATLR